jgi:F420-0:gamma-glutamyl ligase
VRSVVCTDTSQPFERGSAGIAIGITFLYAEIKENQRQLLQGSKAGRTLIPLSALGH